MRSSTPLWVTLQLALFTRAPTTAAADTSTFSSALTSRQFLRQLSWVKLDQANQDNNNYNIKKNNIFDRNRNKNDHFASNGDAAPTSPNRDRSNGNKELLVIRIESPNGSTTASEEQLVNGVFDDDNNVVKQYNLCSNGRFSLKPAQGTNIRNGVATYQTTRAAVGRSTIDLYQEISDNSQATFGRPLENFDQVMVCMPKGTTLDLQDNKGTTSNWIAYVPGEYPFHGFLSVYSDGWCSSVSAGMHEIGHTLGLQHSNEANEEYEDMTGNMGFSIKDYDGPLKCFNPANSWHLGWYSDRSLRVNPLLDAPFRATLTGIVTMNENNDSNVLVQIPNGDTNLYIGYNFAAGFNSGTGEGKNKVLVNQQNAAGLEQQTTLLAKLNEEETYEVKNYLDTGKNLVIQFTKTDDDRKLATVDLYFQKENNTKQNRTTKVRSSNGCSKKNQVRFEVSVVTDAYASDNSWELVKQGTNPIVVASKEEGSFEADSVHDTMVCLDRGANYIFSFFDAYGDGICCSAGWGSYTLFLDGHELLRGGEFGAFDGESSASDKVYEVHHVFTTPTQGADKVLSKVLDDGSDSSMDETCQDDLNFRYEGKSCKWVARNKTRQRCNITWKDKKIKDHCPMACGKCSNEGESYKDDDCSDDKNFRYKGRQRWKCSFIGKDTNNLSRRCQKRSIAKACPVTCGTCAAS